MNTLFNKWKDAVLDQRVWLLFILLQLPAFRSFNKYIPANVYPFIFFYLITLFIFYASILHLGLLHRICIRLLNNGWATLMLFVLATLINYFVYPIADGMKAQMMGSDQDDALIQAGLRLVAGQNPYEARTYFGNPASPGPGWVILVLPFIMSGSYFLLTPVFITCVAIFIRLISGNFYKANLFIVLLMSSIMFWDLLVIGSDVIAIGCLFVGCVVAVYYKWNKKGLFLLGSAALVSLAATSRIVFVYIIPLIGVFLWRRSSLASIKFMIYSGLILFFIHFGFYIWNPGAYTPLHLLNKGGMLLGPKLMVVVALCCAIVGFYTILNVEDKFESWVFFLWLCLITPLAFVSISDLAGRSYAFAQWEGANYLMVTTPVYLAYICLSLPVVENAC